MTSKPDAQPALSAGVCGMISVAWLPWMVYVPENTWLDAGALQMLGAQLAGLQVSADDIVQVKLPADG
jgi:hypothetical protein